MDLRVPRRDAWKVLLVPLLLVRGLAGCAREPARPLFKGAELYSWPDAAGKGWRFVLLPGTNRRKTREEVLASREVVRSPAELAARLSLLAPGEEVFWQVRDGDGFSLPPRQDVQAIVRHAVSRDIRIHVPPP